VRNYQTKLLATLHRQSLSLFKLCALS